jgi:Flp pilus assembly protein TadD
LLSLIPKGGYRFSDQIVLVKKSPPMTQAFRSRLFSSAAMVVMAVSLGGCITARQPQEDVTGSIAAPAGSRSEDEWRRGADAAGERYRANQQNPQAAIDYAQALRNSGQKTQASAVLEQAALANPGHKPLLAAYGRALADVGNFREALEVLARAHTPENPDWRVLSVQGACLDQLGRPDEARRYYDSALKIVPDEPTVLSNLGLSYALSKDLPNAEKVLRRAQERGATDPRVRQNLALVIGLQGRFAEAETIAKADLPPEQAATNIAYLREMISRQGADPARRPARNAAASQPPRS